MSYMFCYLVYCSQGFALCLSFFYPCLVSRAFCYVRVSFFSAIPAYYHSPYTSQSLTYLPNSNVGSPVFWSKSPIALISMCPILIAPLQIFYNYIFYTLLQYKSTFHQYNYIGGDVRCVRSFYKPSYHTSFSYLYIREVSI